MYMRKILSRILMGCYVMAAIYLWVRVMTMWIYSSLTRSVLKRCQYRRN